MSKVTCSVASCDKEATGWLMTGVMPWPACDDHKDPDPSPDPLDRVRKECGLPQLHHG